MVDGTRYPDRLPSLEQYSSRYLHRFVSGVTDLTPRSRVHTRGAGTHAERALRTARWPGKSFCRLTCASRSRREKFPCANRCWRIFCFQGYSEVVFVFSAGHQGGFADPVILLSQVMVLVVSLYYRFNRKLLFS